MQRIRRHPWSKTSGGPWWWGSNCQNEKSDPYLILSHIKKGETPMKFIHIVLIPFLLVIFIPNPSLGDLKTFIKEYTYQASELDSKVSSRIVALEQVKRLLLEELGTYLISETVVKNFQLSKDQVTTYSAGIVRSEIIDEKWDGVTYWLRAKVSANPDEVAESLNVLRKDKQKTIELEELSKKSKEQFQEIEKLKKELELTREGGKKTNEPPPKKLLQNYQEAVKGLSAKDWWEKGYSLQKSGNYAEATNAYNKAIEVDPQYKSAYLFRGIVYVLSGRYQDAIKSFDRAIELNPKDTYAYDNRGSAYSFLGDYAQALKDYGKALELDPQNAATYSNRGLLYANKGNYQKAIEDYDRAINLDPQFDSAYHNRGLSYRKLKDDRQALKNYDQAIELNPQGANFYVSRGLLYSDTGKYQQALKDLDKAIGIAPQDVKAYINRGVTYSRLGNPEQGVKDFNKAIEMDPQNAMAYSNRGTAYHYLGNEEKAISDKKIAARLGLKEAQDLLRSMKITW
jgi:tetratricopeptide (TPR) repeat protein